VILDLNSMIDGGLCERFPSDKRRSSIVSTVFIDGKISDLKVILKTFNNALKQRKKHTSKEVVRDYESYECAKERGGEHFKFYGIRLRKYKKHLLPI